MSCGTLPLTEESVPPHDPDHHGANQDLCLTRHRKRGVGLGQVSVPTEPRQLRQSLR